MKCFFISLLSLVSFAVCAVAKGPFLPKDKAYLDRMILPYVDLREDALETCLHFAVSRTAEMSVEQSDPKLKSFKAVPLDKELAVIPISYQARGITVTAFLIGLGERAHLDVHVTSAGVILCRPREIPKVDEKKVEVWTTLYRVPSE